MSKLFKNKFITASLTLILITNMIFITVMPKTVIAAAYTATVTFSMDSETAMAYKARGLNNELQKGTVKFSNPDFTNNTASFNLGFVRWPGGTNAMFYNWKTGQTGDPMLEQLRKNDDNYLQYVNFRKAQRGTGPEKISDFKDFLRNAGTKTIIPINAATDDVDSVKDLAKYVKDNNIPVIYWELANEPYYWQGLGNNPQMYKNGTDYVVKMKPYNDAIKSILPNAKTLICYGEIENANWNDLIYNYTTPYWNGINFHRYEGAGTTVDAVVRSLNTTIDNTYSDIQNHYVARMRNINAPIFIGEIGVDLDLTVGIGESAYHGIFNTESILRAINHPNVDYIGGFRLYNGYFNAGNKHLDDSIDRYQRNEVVDSSIYDYNEYSAAPGVMSQVADAAINSSSAYWNTTVTGGATVNKTTGTMPAIYAQAFKGDNGKDYAVIVNKSAYSHDVTLKKTQNFITTDLSGTLTKAYAQAPLDDSGNPDLLAKNTDSNKNNVAINTGSTANPVYIPPYSVTRIEWDSGRTAAVHKAYVTHADITTAGTVTVKWIKADGAASYRVKYGTASGSYTFTPISTANTYAGITGLTAGTTYYITVESVDSTGTITNIAENEVSIKMAAPSAPLLRTAYLEGSGEVGVEWQSVPGATGYKVKYGTASGSYTTTVDVGNECGTIIKGLTDGLAYYFVVRAYNPYGESANSAEDPAYPNDNIPYAPNNVRITSQTSTSVSLAWDKTYWEKFRGFFETGDGTGSGWTVRSGQPWSIVSHPDTARLTNTYKCTTNERSIITRGTSAWQDHEIEAKIDVTSYNSGGRVGLAGRFQDINNYYYYTYDNGTQTFRLAKYVNGQSTVLLSKTLEEAGNPNINALRLIFRMEGSTLKCYVGTNLIMEATDNSFSSGLWGLWSNQIAYFDEVTLRRPTTEGTDGTYKLYRSTSPDTGFSQIGGTIQGETYTDNTCSSGVIYYYKLKGVNPTGTSVDYSNTVTKR